MLHFSINPPSFNGLVSLCSRILLSDTNPVLIKSQFFRPFCVVYIDQCLQSLAPDTRLYSKYSELNQYLLQIDFPFLYDGAQGSDPFPAENMIKLNRFNGNIDDLAYEVPKWLREDVLTRSFIPKFSFALEKKIVENLWEIINNAMQHSTSNNGISCCGQFYPQCGYFEIAFSDLGLGIPGSVRRFNKIYRTFSDTECILWALQKGTSTRPDIESGGLGLYYLTEFLKLNMGCLQIISHQGIFQIERSQEKDPVHIRNRINGTLFNLRIIYDDKLYYLEGENI